MSGSTSRTPLADALEAAALIDGLQIKADGGATPEQIELARKNLNENPYADTLMYGGPSDDLRSTFAANANALSVLMNAPGGVQFAGARLDLTGEWSRDDND